MRRIETIAASFILLAVIALMGSLLFPQGTLAENPWPYTSGTTFTGVERGNLCFGVRDDANTAWSTDSNIQPVTFSPTGRVREWPVYTMPTLDAVADSYSIDQNLKSATSNLRLFGVTVLETAGQAVRLAIRDHPGGAGACTGNVYTYISLAANAAQTVDFGARGRNAANGVCVDVVSGTSPGFSIDTATLIEANP